MQEQYYLPSGNVEDYDDEQLMESLQHYHYERALRFKRKATNAFGKPYYPMLRGIEVWHSNMADFLSRKINEKV